MNNYKAEVKYILESMGVGGYLSLYKDQEEIKSLLMKIGRPELYKNYKKQIDKDIEEMKNTIVNKKTREENPNFIYSDDDSDYVTESDISSEEEEMTYAEMIQVVKSENDFYYLE